jgi:hypothetical protein
MIAGGPLARSAETDRVPTEWVTPSAALLLL